MASVLKFMLMGLMTLSLLFTLSNGNGTGTDEVERKAYIVYMGNGPETGVPAVDHHHSLLRTAIGDEKLAMKHRITSYGRSINAFAAWLLPHEAERLKGMEGVISLFPSTMRKLRTTRSWDFVRLPLSAKRNKLIESDLIVGLIDSGIYVDNPSFNDKGYGPPPAKWKGSCDKGTNFSGCNNKVIGARSYHYSDTGSYEDPTPVDTDGHGTHTSSTAAGVAVDGASFYGIAEGTARGGVPSARIAMYKACWLMGCSDMDILAAFDDAIADGVDLLSLSLGGPGNSYFNDVIAIGTFHAMKKGILSACSAGNDGPFAYSVENNAPWIFTIGASGTDRKFMTDVKLGNGKTFSGPMVINSFAPKKKSYPLIDGASAANRSSALDPNSGDPSACDYGTLLASKVKGKLVYCLPGFGDQEMSIKDYGGVGFIMPTSTQSTVAFTYFVPASIVSSDDGEAIERYINTTKNPTAVIKKTRLAKQPAPFVVYFSSRGPNSVSDFILKPDIAAPGADILAGWSRLDSVTERGGDDRYVDYNIVSGTSMACPHAAGASAYVKTFHPDWSPAAIKSALMTTAGEIKVPSELTNNGPLDYGAGQINPTRALHPGLVYDATPSDYISFLCKEGYNGTALSLIVGATVNCTKYDPTLGIDGLNYPSMQYMVRDPAKPLRAVFVRTVTNVGFGTSVYKATVKAVNGLSVTVVPDTLKFNKVHEKKSFKVLVKAAESAQAVSTAVLEWSDSKHRVRSPIVLVKAADSGS